MPGPSSRKRAYRQNVKCSLCLKEVQEDNFQKHKDKQHNNDPACRALIPVDNKQQKLGFRSTSVNDPTNELEFASLSSSTDKNSNIQDDDPDDPAALSFTESSPTQSHLGLLQPRPPVQEPGTSGTRSNPGPVRPGFSSSSCPARPHCEAPAASGTRGRT